MFEQLHTEFLNPPTDPHPSWRNSPILTDWTLAVHSQPPDDDPDPDSTTPLPKTHTYKIHKIFFVQGRGRSEFLCAQIERWAESASKNHTDLSHLLPEVNQNIFEMVLDYAYGQPIVICNENVVYLLKTSRVLQMRALGEMCLDHVTRIFSTLNLASDRFWDAVGNNAVYTSENNSCAKKALNQSGWNASVMASRAKRVRSFVVDISAMAGSVSGTVTSANSYVMVGFVDGDNFKSQGANHHQSGYFLHCYNGSLYSHTGDNNRPYMNRAIGVGEKMEANYDKDKKTIAFSVGKDGEMTSYGVAFENVSDDVEWYPCVDFYSQNAVLRLDRIVKEGELEGVMAIAQSASQLMPGMESILDACIPFLAQNFEKLDLEEVALMNSDALEVLLSCEDLSLGGKSFLVSHAIALHLRGVHEDCITNDQFHKLVSHITNIRLEDALPLLSPASKLNNADLLEKCMEALKRGFWKIIRHDSRILQNIPTHSLVVKLLDSDHLCIQHEDQVFDSILNYTKDTQLSPDQQSEVWSTCRFAFLSSERLLLTSDMALIPQRWIRLGFAVSKLPSGQAHKIHQLAKLHGSRLVRRTGLCLKWDAEAVSDAICFTQDGSVASKISTSNAWDGAVITSTAESISYFAVEVMSHIKGNYLMIGFVDGALYRPGGNNYQAAGFFIDCSSGSLYSHQGDNNRTFMSRSVSAGDTIEATYDRGKRTISFSIIGKQGNVLDFGVAFSGVTAIIGGLWPCVDFYYNGSSVVKLSRVR